MTTRIQNARDLLSAFGWEGPFKSAETPKGFIVIDMWDDPVSAPMGSNSETADAFCDLLNYAWDQAL